MSHPTHSGQLHFRTNFIFIRLIGHALGLSSSSMSIAIAIIANNTLQPPLQLVPESLAYCSLLTQNNVYLVFIFIYYMITLKFEIYLDPRAMFGMVSVSKGSGKGITMVSPMSCLATRNRFVSVQRHGCGDAAIGKPTGNTPTILHCPPTHCCSYNT